MKRFSYFIATLLISIFAFSCSSEDPMGEWDLMKWNYEGSALKTKPKKVFNVPKEGHTYQFKCTNYNRFWLSSIEEKANNEVKRHDQNDDIHNINGDWSNAKADEKVLTITIAPNMSDAKRYTEVAVTAGDVFDYFYFEQE